MSWGPATFRLRPMRSRTSTVAPRILLQEIAALRPRVLDSPAILPVGGTTAAINARIALSCWWNGSRRNARPSRGAGHARHPRREVSGVVLNKVAVAWSRLFDYGGYRTYSAERRCLQPLASYWRSWRQARLPAEFRPESARRPARLMASGVPDHADPGAAQPPGMAGGRDATAARYGRAGRPVRTRLHSHPPSGRR